MYAGIINYGLGNLGSLNRIILNLGFNVKIINTPNEILNCDKIILPGVGSFNSAMKLLKEGSWVEPLSEHALVKKRNFFGICLGMQLLSSSSSENGKTLGLNFIEGEVVNLKELNCREKIPHIGWNSVNFKSNSKIIKGIENLTDFYFVHSYAFKPKDKTLVVANTKYEIEFCSIINKENIFGTQFHPEKSSKSGRKILENFLNA
jgi:glutamine amidotransferase